MTEKRDKRGRRESRSGKWKKDNWGKQGMGSGGRSLVGKVVHAECGDGGRRRRQMHSVIGVAGAGI